uniref:G-protein coupled receptors family 1 profile domain-containing protein n=1 Tax=Anabas testudineus TaxID=64144 RepID=A0A3Q1K8E6_ANATE
MVRCETTWTKSCQSSVSSFLVMEPPEETELCFPQLLNSSCRKLKRPHAETVLIYIVLSSISLLTAALNLLLIISISHFKQLHTPTNLLLRSLAVSDFFVGILMSFQIILTNGCWFLGDMMCTIYCISEFIMTSASVGNMVLISVDRYIAICDPLHYHTKITVRGVTNFQDNLKQPGQYNHCYGQCVAVINYTAGIIDVILTFICPVTVIIVLYLRVFVVAASHARAVRPHITAVTLQRLKIVHVNKSEMKAATTLGHNTLFGITSVPLETWLFYLNSSLNPVIYAFCYPWFLKSIKLIATFKILQHDSCEANIL